ncbi:hypothetical protein RRG08_010822 [Elysia crispata]|uniref:Uncharacterized protein n=1 Tax=Elysia crispata TaxID=231223 RepID=A0AAE1DF36_9GAST|nr:hypothetical protein RRG08_010822 [Elysia crispata]
MSSLQNSTPKRPNVVTAPDETSIAIHSNKFIDAIENLATPPERSTFVPEPSPILDECSQFQSPGRTVPLHKNGVGAETALNSTFTVHELSDEQIDHETTLVSADPPSRVRS